MAITAAVITDIEDAIVSALSNDSVTAYAYESVEMDETQIVTLMLESVEPGAYGLDQSYGLGKIEWTLRYYVDVSESPKTAQTNMKSGIAQIYDTFGADTTIANAAKNVAIGPGRMGIATGANRLELVFEAPVIAIPHTNLG